MKWSIFIIFSILTQWSTTQNLVTNASFEITEKEFCGIMTHSDYSSTVSDWYAPSFGSPDLFFTNIDSSCWNFLPNSSYDGPIGIKGSQIPRTGEIMTGLFLYTIQGLEQREYIQVPLNTPLTVGKRYVVECFVSLADSTEFATNQLGMYLSTQPVSLSSDGVLNYTPQVISNNFITDTQNWTRVADTLIATDSYAYLTIGNFSSDVQTPITPNPTASNKPGTYGSYYFIDDIRVEHIRGLNTEEFDIVDFKKPAKKLIKIIDFMGRETVFKPNIPLIYIYSDGTRERVIKMEE